MSVVTLEIRPDVDVNSSQLSGDGKNTSLGLNTVYYQPYVGNRKNIYSAGAGTTAITLSEDPSKYTYINIGGSRWADWSIACQPINSMYNGYGAMIFTHSYNKFSIYQYNYNSATRTFTLTNKIDATIPTANNANLTWSNSNQTFWQARAYDEIQE